MSVKSSPAFHSCDSEPSVSFSEPSTAGEELGAVGMAVGPLMARPVCQFSTGQAGAPRPPRHTGPRLTGWSPVYSGELKKPLIYITKVLSKTKKCQQKGMQEVNKLLVSRQCRSSSILGGMGRAPDERNHSEQYGFHQGPLMLSAGLVTAIMGH